MASASNDAGEAWRQGKARDSEGGERSLGLVSRRGQMKLKAWGQRSHPQAKDFHFILQTVGPFRRSIIRKVL